MDDRTGDGGLTLGWIFFVVGVAGGGIIAAVALVLGHEGIAAIAAFGAVVAGSASLLEGTGTRWGRAGSRWNMADADFEKLVEDVERQGSGPAGTPSREGRNPHDPDDFAALVREALDELPDFMQAELRGNLAVVVSDEGTERGAYGLYFGGTVARGDVGHQITIFRDTLLRDFGDDPGELRRQVTITVRHELAHHLGGDETHVRDLGL